ncbi:hypothetical protein NP233_g2597 [Leucocoprinus birnbaumii]|uniref:2-oxoisovalerate dehydrogenase subunit alpha n=1 Tax=Leucocoprinus birnbaumii TaxID=56174 RepID=A0AAD5W4A2_9AGAR|nr:hypothetical protein NP233_g2597 [Leucocoprinus birnbaumii]
MIRTAATARRTTSNAFQTRSFAQTALRKNKLPTTNSPIVNKLQFINSVTGSSAQIPTYRVLDGVGKPIEGAELPEIDKAYAHRLYEHMQLLPALDNVLYNVQRQGKISFYMTSHGEEATIIGSAAALANEDEVLGQYREMGVLLWRGFTIDDAMNQCFGNEKDGSGKGRQMPVIPQAAGVGYALKRDPNRRSKNIAACFFGEGAASEGDFHAGFMLASTIPSPTLYICRNNGFAISTPSTEQYYGDGIAARGPGYGIDTIRVDGNDILAVLNAVKEARRRTLEQGRAVLVEAMSYRVGHHSTSDDSFAYRARSEVEDRKRIDNPLTRFRLFMESLGWWNEEAENELKASIKTEVMKSFKRAESLKRCELGELFTDVYGGEEPWNIKEQREELSQLLKKYGQVWEPWRSELSKFKNNGKDLLGSQ